jgi:hypothetical protein
MKYIEQRPSLLLRCGERNNKGTGFELAGGLHFILCEIDVYMAEQQSQKNKNKFVSGGVQKS